MWNRLVSHPHVVDKNLGGLSWEQGVPATYQVPTPGFRDKKISPHNFWLQKSAGIESVKENAEAPNSSS